MVWCVCERVCVVAYDVVVCVCVECGSSWEDLPGAKPGRAGQERLGSNDCCLRGKYKWVHQHPHSQPSPQTIILSLLWKHTLLLEDLGESWKDWQGRVGRNNRMGPHHELGRE